MRTWHGQGTTAHEAQPSRDLCFWTTVLPDGRLTHRCRSIEKRWRYDTWRRHAECWTTRCLPPHGIVLSLRPGAHDFLDDLEPTLTAKHHGVIVLLWHPTTSPAFGLFPTSSFPAFKRLPFDLAASEPDISFRTACIAYHLDPQTWCLLILSRELLDTHFCFLASLESSRRRLPRELNFLCTIHAHPHGSFYAHRELKNCSHAPRTICTTITKQLKFQAYAPLTPPPPHCTDIS